MELIGLLESLGASVSSEQERADLGVDAVLDVGMDGASTRFAVETKSRAPYPNEVRSMTSMRERLESVGVPLLVVPYVSEAVGETLSAAHWSWVDVAGNADIRAPGLRLQRRVTSSPPKTLRRNLPAGAGSWAIIRCLIADGMVDGATATAKRVGVSQPRASQVLRHLTEAGFVERDGRSRWTADRSALLDAFLAEYSGPGGSTVWLYSLDPPMTLAARTAEAAAARGVRIGISGDVAADTISPWRMPTLLTVYLAAPVATSELEAVPAHGPDDANVEVIVPSDASVFDGAEHTAMPLAHTTQVIWDLQRAGGTDREEAAGRVRSWLLSR